MIKKALILTYQGFQDQEVIYPYYRLKEEGFHVDIVAQKDSIEVMGIFGIKFPINYSVESLSIFNQFDDYTLLVIPGGVKALEKLRQHEKSLIFINKWNESEKLIASTCHGAQMLISARVTKGRTIAGYYSIKDDIVNSGATYCDDPCVIDRNIISSPHYKDMGEWMKDTLVTYYNKYGKT